MTVLRYRLVPHPGPVARLRARGFAVLGWWVSIGVCVAAAQEASVLPGTPPRPPLRFAVIGDYGVDTVEEADVARKVAELRPDLVITVGDDNYPAGEAATIDANIGRHYARWIGNYSGAFGPGAIANQFFPSLGNHDWVATGAAPYLSYFTLPGNERYYDFVRGPVHFYAIDSDGHEPDGNTATSIQAQWLQSRLATATEPFQVVYFHHPPFSSASHGDTPELQWPFGAWGADLVLSGHDHSYERVQRDGLTYVVNGLGGAPRYGFGAPVAGSAVRYNADHGAMIVDATPSRLTLEFVSRTGFVQDRTTIGPTPITPTQVTLVASGSTWRYRDDGVDPPVNWNQPGFDDSSWSSGPAQLGYGDGDEATVVSFGSDPNAKHVTTWFRRTFTVADPTLLGTVAIEILRDDGAIAYLNGVEVVRTNMPAPPTTSASLAPNSIGGAAESAFTAWTLPEGLLVAGTNTLAVEVHQNAPTSSDVSFDLRLRAQSWGTRLVARGSTWRYRDTGVAPPFEWIQPTYDDSSWSIGPAQLGYGDGDEATVISYGPNPSQKHVTSWFRHTFTLPGSPTYSSATLRLLRDDGAIVHVNGVEVFRQNLPRSGVTPSTTTEYPIVRGDENTFVDTRIDGALLHPGPNVITVELHQDSPSGPDASFDLELFGL